MAPRQPGSPWKRLTLRCAGATPKKSFAPPSSTVSRWPTKPCARSGWGAGTTLAVAEIQGKWIRTYHVGDSGVVVVGQRGSVRTRTVDHSPTGYALEAGLMDEHEAIHHEERHILSNAVGAKDMRIDVGSSVQMGSRDTVLLASDGLFDNLVLDAILDRVRTGPVAEGVADLCRSARRRMTRPSDTQPSKPDDLTIVAFRRPAA